MGNPILYIVIPCYNEEAVLPLTLSLIHISEPTRLGMISYAVFCLKKKKEDATSTMAAVQGMYGE